MTGYSLPNFAKEKSGNHISFQKYGKPEPFSGGRDNDSVLANPRWFRPGEPLTNICTQLEVVEELTGLAPGLSEEEED